MVTPFDTEGDLDLDGAVALARWLGNHGSDGLVVAGTTGEGSTLTDREKADLWRAVAEAVTIPVIAGSGNNDTAHSVEITKAATQAGVAGILAVTPYYNRPSQAGIAAHFEAIASATHLPVIVYDIPVRTGRAVALDTMLSLAQGVPNIVGVKDATGNAPGAARLIASAPGGFEHYSGDDSMTLPFLSVGSVGVIGVATHWAGEVFAEMINCFAKADLVGARLANARLISSYNFETSDEAPNPVPTKEMLKVLGLPGGSTRLPMGPAPEGLAERARSVYSELATSSGIDPAVQFGNAGARG
jgi:4-hydroxy-tetrahydrodipicolinate synthase